jgi:hypothetical protein
MIYRVLMRDGFTFHMEVGVPEQAIRVAFTHKFPIPETFWTAQPYSLKGSGGTLEALAIKVATESDFDDYDVSEIVEVGMLNATPQLPVNSHQPLWQDQKPTGLGPIDPPEQEPRDKSFSNLRHRISRLTFRERQEKAQEEVRNIENCLGRLKIILEQL